MTEITERRYIDGKLVTLVALIAGVIALVLWLVGLGVNARQALFSYLAAFTYVTSLVLGVLIFFMIANTMSAKWPVVTRRLQEGVVATFPVLVVLFVPVAVGAGYLYIWVEPTGDLPEHLAHLLHHKEPYLNLPFFLVRTALYFAVWIVVAELLRRWSLARDRREVPGEDGEAQGRAPRGIGHDRALSAAMLPLVGLCVTFAAFDWLMSLQPSWFSSMFGVYYFAGGFVGGLALLTVLVYAAQRWGMVGDEITHYHYHSLGRMLFAFVVFWAYIAFFQAMLIRIANKPEEVPFYILRVEDSWRWYVYALIIGHFVAPFLLLLPKGIKHRPGAMAAIAAWLLFIHYIDIYWLVLPVLHPGGADPHWLDVVALVAVTGVIMAFAGWRQRGHPVLPYGDPRLARSIDYRSAG